MTTKTRIAAIATVVPIGIAILFKAPGLGGFVIGAALIATIALAIVDHYVTRLRSSARELEDARKQYRAAYTTLGSQRRRMLAEMEGRIAEHTARLNAAHNAELFETQRECYEQGAIDALNGRLVGYQEHSEAAVIPIAPHLLRARTGHSIR